MHREKTAPLEIISTGRGNSISIEGIPPEYWGISFDEALVELKEKKNWILMGIKRKDKIYTNPWRMDLEEDDKIFVLKET